MSEEEKDRGHHIWSLLVTLCNFHGPQPVTRQFLRYSPFVKWLLSFLNTNKNSLGLTGYIYDHNVIVIGGWSEESGLTSVSVLTGVSGASPASEKDSDSARFYFSWFPTSFAAQLPTSSRFWLITWFQLYSSSNTEIFLSTRSPPSIKQEVSCPQNITVESV